MSGPSAGQIWIVEGDDPLSAGVYLGGSVWSVLSRSQGEFTLLQVKDLVPVRLWPSRPKSLLWADQFDTLAVVAGIDMTWADEVAAYRDSGLSRFNSM